MLGIFIQGDHLQHLVGPVEDGAAGGLVDAAVLHAHQPVLHDVQQADAVGLDLEDPANEPLYDKPGFLEMGVSPATAPDAPAYDHFPL